MTRVTRYILTELCLCFGLALLGMTLLMLLVGVAQEAMRQGLGPQPVMRLLPYLVPNALRFAVPGTILFAACSVYGRMSADNEVLAAMSIGVSPLRIIRPALILSLAVSLITVWLNDVAESWGRAGVRRVVMSSVEQIAYGMLRTQRTYTTPRLSISVKGVQGQKLLLPTVTIYGSDDGADVVVSAQEAELRFDAEREVLSVLLTNGEAIYDDDIRAVFPDTLPGEIPLSAASREGDDQRGPSEMAMWEIRPAIARQQRLIEQLEKNMAAEAAVSLAIGDFPALEDGAWLHRHRELRESRFQVNRLFTEPWRRWANGFSCFCFVLVGAPLAVYLRNGDLWTTFAVCFFPILILYYPLLMFGISQAKSGSLPPQAVWIANLGLLLIGGLLLWRTTRR